MVATTQGTDRVILHNISWEQYEKLLEDFGDRANAWMVYQDGTLEIITPSPEHEHFKEAIGDVIKDFADSSGLEFESYGSTIWRKQAMMAGVEPDNCFYFQNESLIRSGGE